MKLMFPALFAGPFQVNWRDNQAVFFGFLWATVFWNKEKKILIETVKTFLRECMAFLWLDGRQNWGLTTREVELSKVGFTWFSKGLSYDIFQLFLSGPRRRSKDSLHKTETSSLVALNWVFATILEFKLDSHESKGIK